MVGQMVDEAIEPIGDRRAGRTARLVVGPEHEVVDEELRTAFEEVRERDAPFIGLEPILLVNPDPREFLPSLRQLIALLRELLLRVEHLEPRCQPLFTCSGLMVGHRFSPSLFVPLAIRHAWWS
jgi:hypothetical protein